jgi:hypothetical protein
MIHTVFMQHMLVDVRESSVIHRSLMADLGSTLSSFQCASEDKLQFRNACCKWRKIRRNLHGTPQKGQSHDVIFFY